MPLDSTFMVESIFTHCMDLRSSQPFWIVRDGLLRAYPALNSAATCDVIVLGGGITGALIALHLTEAGFDVIVLDKREIDGAAPVPARRCCNMRLMCRCAS